MRRKILLEVFSPLTTDTEERAADAESSFFWSSRKIANGESLLATRLIKRPTCGPQEAYNYKKIVNVSTKTYGTCSSFRSMLRTGWD
jgi:hypothetical protein